MADLMISCDERHAKAERLPDPIGSPGDREPPGTARRQARFHHNEAAARSLHVIGATHASPSPHADRWPDFPQRHDGYVCLSAHGLILRVIYSTLSRECRRLISDKIRVGLSQKNSADRERGVPGPQGPAPTARPIPAPETTSHRHHHRPPRPRLTRHHRDQLPEPVAEATRWECLLSKRGCWPQDSSPPRGSLPRTAVRPKRWNAVPSASVYRTSTVPKTASAAVIASIDAVIVRSAAMVAERVTATVRYAIPSVRYAAGSRRITTAAPSPTSSAPIHARISLIPRGPGATSPVNRLID